MIFSCRVLYQSSFQFYPNIYFSDTLSSSVWVYIFLKQTSGHLPPLYNNLWYLENKFQTFKIIQDYSLYGWKVTFTATSPLENNLYYAIILNLIYLHISPWPCFCVSLKLLVCCVYLTLSPSPLLLLFFLPWSTFSPFILQLQTNLI